MFGFGKSKKNPPANAPDKPGLFGRLKAGLSRTRSNLTEGVADLVLGSKQIDDDLFEELEMQLLTADVGVDATRKIIDNLTQRASRHQLKDAQALMVSAEREYAGDATAGFATLDYT